MRFPTFAATLDMLSGHAQAPRAWPQPRRTRLVWLLAVLAPLGVVLGCWMGGPAYAGSLVEYPLAAVTALGALGLLGGWRASTRHWLLRAVLLLAAVLAALPLVAVDGPRALGELAGAALAEELAFRVALPAVLAAALGRLGLSPRAGWPLAWGLGALGFALLPGHLSQGVPLTSFVAFALVQSVILWWNRDVVLVVLTHLLVDLAGLAVPGGWSPAGYQRLVLVGAVVLAAWGGRWAARPDDVTALQAAPPIEGIAAAVQDLGVSVQLGTEA